VSSRLSGLDEKFRVYLKDSLADALKERLDELTKRDLKWTPEILHLLLELSDRPVSNSHVGDLEFLKEEEVDTGPPLRWQELVAEDPLLREKSVWKNVDFGGDSADEDGFEEESRSEDSGTEGTGQSSVDEEYIRVPEEMAVGAGDKEELERVRSAQFWKKTMSVNGVKLETVKKPVTELQAVREVLFMLGGYPASLFEIDSGVISPSKGYALKHASNDAFYKLAQGLADQGSAVMALRMWLKRPQAIPLLQVLQSSISKRLIDFDTLLSSIQQRFVAPKRDVVVSLLSVQVEVESSLRPLIRLSTIIKELDTDRYAHAFKCLEMLYDETCISQMAGDDGMYAFMGKIFFDCFQVYLRPLRIWMEDGELRKDDKIFFVSEAAGEVELASLWESRFKIRKTQTGVLHAPSFLHAAANKIFTTGKSVVVLKYLNQFTSLQSSRSTFEPTLDFDMVCNPSFLQLAPFTELFDVAFDSWVQSKHHLASSALHKILFDSYGLHTSLDAFSHLYFMADGTTAAAFANSIFDKLDTLDSSWNDRFTLTELARSTFGSLLSIAPDHLRTSILSLPRKYQDVAKCRRSVKTLAAVELGYHLSWPIQIVLTKGTIYSYQRIFTFLLQVRRSSHILSRQRPISDGLDATSSTDERSLYYSLRTRLVWFTQTLYYYLTSLVIEPSSHVMREKLRAAEDVDAMISVHDTYIKTLKDQALLGNKLELIHKTILKILDLGIKLEDAQAANTLASKEALEQQQEMMDISMASLGLRTSHHVKASKFQRQAMKMDGGDSSEDEGKEIDVDLSILSSNYDEDEDLFVDKLRKMKAEFDRLVRFVASGLRGVARAGSGEGSRSWDVLGEMLESGLGNGNMGYR